MKKTLLTLSAFALLHIAANAQAPAGFNYQGIARTSSGAPMASKGLGMRITIHDGSATGTPVYQETQTVTTNPYGLYNMTIGSGTAVTGTLGGVNWAAGAKFIQVEMDAAGGTAYADLGTSQLQSVPYAMAAASAPAPTLTLTGNVLSAGGNTITLPAGTSYTAGTGIAISGGAISTNLTAGTGITVTGASVAANNTTALWNANQLQGKAVSTTAPTNGQELVWNSTTSAWTPTTPATPTTYTGGTGITVSGTGVISANNLSGDVSGATSATTVGKIQGTSVATTAPTNGQVLKFNGTAYAPARDTGITSTSTTNYLPKTTGAGTEGNSAIYENNSRIGINTTTPQLDLDIVADTFGIRNSGATWDNLWFHVDGSYASINANGADNGLMLRVGANGGGFGTGITYSSTASTLDTVMMLLPNGNVGINTMTPKSTMEVVGSFAAAIKNVSFTAAIGASYAAGDEHTIIVSTATTVLTSTVTLPNAANMKGRIYVIRRVAATGGNPQVVSIASSGGTLNGTTALTTGGITCVTFQSDGANWYSINQF